MMPSPNWKASISLYNFKYLFLVFLQYLKKHHVNIKVQFGYDDKERYCIGLPNQRDAALLYDLFLEIGADFDMCSEPYIYTLRDNHQFLNKDLYQKYSAIILEHNIKLHAFESLVQSYPDIIYPLVEELFLADGSINYFKVIKLSINDLKLLDQVLQNGMKRLQASKKAAETRVKVCKESLQGFVAERCTWSDNLDDITAPIKRNMLIF